MPHPVRVTAAENLASGRPPSSQVSQPIIYWRIVGTATVLCAVLVTCTIVSVVWAASRPAIPALIENAPPVAPTIAHEEESAPVHTRNNPDVPVPTLVAPVVTRPAVLSSELVRAESLPAGLSRPGHACAGDPSRQHHERKPPRTTVVRLNERSEPEPVLARIDKKEGPVLAAPARPAAAPPARGQPARVPAVIPGEPAYETCGTSVRFVSDPVLAARLAVEEHKLLLMLHVSGNFEDQQFT